MKSRMVSVAFALLLGVLSFSSDQYANAESPQAGQPKLAITSFEHSFGSVKPGTPLVYSFEVRNEGKVDLEITSVKPSCGCTTTKYDKIIPPGKAGTITLAIEKTTGYKGEVTKTASVTTNDPERPSFSLTLRATFTE